ncbi:MAG TPA: sigma-70 family RNA polymerase sigma factor [Pirellulales bacterium]|nr:sigma-70 family RNA polymerase sigma factor [Pirellulales bacterium]
MKAVPDPAAITDVELVGRTHGGDRAAFGELVGRHQAAVCAVAYTMLGDVGRSEDVAQEAFLAAWRQLGELRELAKFKSWVCGIAHNLALAAARRQPKTKPLDDVVTLPAPGPTPAERAICHEEQVLVWQALGDLPETYREPLVLFYRDGETVAGVAAALELTEAAVKQRLARGREMLRTDLAAMVESALKRSAPGAAFTAAVLAALPGIGAASASAATVGLGTSAAPAAKAAASVAASAAGGALLGVAGAALGAWCSWKAARYERERQLYRRAIVVYTFGLAVFIAPFAAMAFGWWNPRVMGQASYLAWFAAWMLGFFTLSGLWTWQLIRRWRRIVREEAAAGSPELPMTRLRDWQSRWEGRQWTSSAHLLGLPLVEIRFGGPQPPTGEALFVRRPPHVARGWIAIGERAYGVILAIGNVAVGGIAVGGVFSAGLVALGTINVGVFAVGALSLGVVGIGGLGTGVFALGGMALGWCALGGCAMAWRAAKGGVACAHDFAVGASATAAHANDQAARDFIAQCGFFDAGERLMDTMNRVPLVLVAVIALAICAVWPVAYRRRRPG